jgi:hypothetical protein
VEQEQKANLLPRQHKLQAQQLQQVEQQQREPMPMSPSTSSKPQPKPGAEVEQQEPKAQEPVRGVELELLQVLAQVSPG